ncbi:MAG TPA: ribosomal protein S18-alanine N-acetyltransferase, partial [Armatimonadota bacterium]
MSESSPFHITPMSRADVPRVHALETRCFSAPWDIASYYGEVENPAAVYLVLRDAEEIWGFGGMWVVEHEAHIVTIAVHPDYRRRGLGRQLLTALLREARQRQVDIITLEVRVSNVAAQGLYTAFGF